MSPTRIEGGCFCGSVRYAASEPPRGSAVCHCQSCRRSANAPAVPWTTFARADFAFTRGQPKTFKSSDDVRRTFCADCGGPLTYEHDKRPDEVDVTTCSLDAPQDFAPAYHIWLADELPWVRLADGLPAYPEWKTD